MIAVLPMETTVQCGRRPALSRLQNGHLENKEFVEAAGCVSGGIVGDYLARFSWVRKEGTMHTSHVRSMSSAVRPPARSYPEVVKMTSSRRQLLLLLVRTTYLRNLDTYSQFAKHAASARRARSSDHRLCVLPIDRFPHTCLSLEVFVMFRAWLRWPPRANM